MPFLSTRSAKTVNFYESATKRFPTNYLNGTLKTLLICAVFLRFG